MADWNSIYADQLALIEDPTKSITDERDTTLNKLTTNKDAAVKDLEGRRDADITARDKIKETDTGTLKQTLADALQQAYISQEMSKKDLPYMMSNLGLTGGVTETAANDLLRSYRNSSNSANKSYNTSLTDLDRQYGIDVGNIRSTYGGNIADIVNTYNTNYGTTQSNYATQLREALANRLTNATNNANTRYGQQVAEDQAAWERSQVNNAANSAGTTSGLDASSNNTGSGGRTESNQSGISSTGTTSNSKEQSNSAKAQGYQAVTNKLNSGTHAVKVNGVTYYMPN